MPRYSRTLTPAAQAAFLADLGRGALVEAAAEAAGVPVSTLYCRRGRDPAFAAAWKAAVWESARAGRALPHGRKRRMRLGAAERMGVLVELGASCNTTMAAEAARVHRATIYRHLRSDPGFARASAAALESGYAWLEGELRRQRAASAARPRPPLEPTGTPTADFDEGMKLLARWTRPDGSIGRRFVRKGRLSRWPFEKAMAALDRRLRWLGVRRGREDKAEPGG